MASPGDKVLEGTEGVRDDDSSDGSLTDGDISSDGSLTDGDISSESQSDSDSEASATRPAVGGKRPAVGGKRPAVGGKRPAVGGKRPAVGGKRPAVGGKRPAVIASESDDSSDDSSVDAPPDWMLELNQERKVQKDRAIALKNTWVAYMASRVCSGGLESYIRKLIVHEAFDTEYFIDERGALGGLLSELNLSLPGDFPRDSVYLTATADKYATMDQGMTDPMLTLDTLARYVRLFYTPKEVDTIQEVMRPNTHTEAIAALLTRKSGLRVGSLTYWASIEALSRGYKTQDAGTMATRLKAVATALETFCKNAQSLLCASVRSLNLTTRKTAPSGAQRVGRQMPVSKEPLFVEGYNPQTRPARARTNTAQVPRKEHRPPGVSKQHKSKKEKDKAGQHLEEKREQESAHRVQRQAAARDAAKKQREQIAARARVAERTPLAVPARKPQKPAKQAQKAAPMQSTQKARKATSEDDESDSDSESSSESSSESEEDSKNYEQADSLIPWFVEEDRQAETPAGDPVVRTQNPAEPEERLWFAEEDIDEEDRRRRHAEEYDGFQTVQDNDWRAFPDTMDIGDMDTDGIPLHLVSDIVPDAEPVRLTRQERAQRKQKRQAEVDARKRERQLRKQEKQAAVAARQRQRDERKRRQRNVSDAIKGIDPVAMESSQALPLPLPLPLQQVAGDVECADAVTLVSREQMRTVLLIRDDRGQWASTLVAAFKRAVADGERRLVEEGGDKTMEDADGLRTFIKYVGHTGVLHDVQEVDKHAHARIKSAQVRRHPTRRAGDPLLLILNATDIGSFSTAGVSLARKLDEYNTLVFDAGAKNVNANGQMVIIIDEAQLQEPSDAAAILRLVHQPVQFEVRDVMARMLPPARMELAFVNAVRDKTVTESEAANEQRWIAAVPTGNSISVDMAATQSETGSDDHVHNHYPVQIAPYTSFIRVASETGTEVGFREQLSDGLYTVLHINDPQPFVDKVFSEPYMQPYGDEGPTTYGYQWYDQPRKPQPADGFVAFLKAKWKQQHPGQNLHGSLSALSSVYNEFKRAVIGAEAFAMARAQRELEQGTAVDDLTHPSVESMFAEYTSLLVPAQVYVTLRPHLQPLVDDLVEMFEAPVGIPTESELESELPTGLPVGSVDAKTASLWAARVYAFRNSLGASERPTQRQLFDMLAPHGLGLDALVTVQAVGIGFARCGSQQCNVPLDKAISMMHGSADVAHSVRQSVAGAFQRAFPASTVRTNDDLTNTVVPEQSFQRDGDDVRLQAKRGAYASLALPADSPLVTSRLRAAAMGRAADSFVRDKPLGKTPLKALPWREHLRRVTVDAALESVLVCGLRPERAESSLAEMLQQRVECQRGALAALAQAEGGADGGADGDADNPLDEWFSV